MRRFCPLFRLKIALVLLALTALPAIGRAVELKVSRAAGANAEAATSPIGFQGTLVPEPD